jgi:hypothetical protein
MAASSQAQEIHAFIERIRLARDQNAVEEDIPGWRLRRPLFAEVEDRIAFLVAESKGGNGEPFLLPLSSEVVIAVTCGSVEITGTNATILASEQFYVLRAGSQRAIRSLQHPTTITCMFFRAEGVDGGQPMGSR